ncbi:hypothetical protein CsSME_00048126 [Camellia sinensis var. sinensis]
MHVLNYPLYAFPKKPLIFALSCNSTPRPSCIKMRDWWHEDRANQKPAIF